MENKEGESYFIWIKIHDIWTVAEYFNDEYWLHGTGEPYNMPIQEIGERVEREANKASASESKEQCNIAGVITPFWLWLVREAKIEVINAENYIEVHGFKKEGDNMIPVISFAELLELYKSQNGL